MALVCTFFPSSLSPPKGATGMCLVDVPEYIPNFEKHVTVGFFFFFLVSIVSVVSTLCCAVIELLLLAAFLQRHASEICPAAGCRARRWVGASAGGPGFQVLRLGPARLWPSPPHAPLTPARRPALSHKLLGALRTVLPACPPRRLPMPPPRHVGVSFPPISATVCITQQILKNWQLIIMFALPPRY